MGTEDMKKSFDEFESFQDFFTREVKERSIVTDKNHLVSPADSTI